MADEDVDAGQARVDGELPTTSATGSPELSIERVHSRLRGAILRGEFDPQVPISQVQLANELGVSRTPLREALRMLQREGLIRSERNRRVRVAELSVHDLEQLYAMRIMADALAVRLGVGRFTAADFADMEDALDRMRQETGPHNLDRWEQAHRDYHQTLCRHAGRRFLQVTEDLSDYTERYRRQYLAEPAAWTAAAREHAAILAACRSRTPTTASHDVARHLARTALTLLAMLAPEHDPVPVREALQLVTADGLQPDHGVAVG